MWQLHVALKTNHIKIKDFIYFFFLLFLAVVVVVKHSPGLSWPRPLPPIPNRSFERRCHHATQCRFLSISGIPNFTRQTTGDEMSVSELYKGTMSANCLSDTSLTTVPFSGVFQIIYSVIGPWFADCTASDPRVHLTVAFFTESRYRVYHGAS